jgi:hypothetical protein
LVVCRTSNQTCGRIGRNFENFGTISLLLANDCLNGMLFNIRLKGQTCFEHGTSWL